MVFKFEIEADLLNLYLPKDYINIIDGIMISFLPVAKEFEKERKRPRSPFSQHKVKTAKVIFSVKLGENNPHVAIENFKKTISDYEFLLSFINRRDVATGGEYVCYLVNGTGKQVIRREPSNKFYFNIPNNKPVIVSGIHTGPVTFTSNISSFLDLIFEKFRNLENNELFNQKDVLIAINLYLLTLEENYEQIKFIQVWTALEALANKLYRTIPPPPGVRFLLTSEEKSEFITKVEELIEEFWLDLEHRGERDRKNKLKDRLQQPYIYEMRTIDKIKNLLKYLKISEEESKINETLNKAGRFRNNIMHYDNSIGIDLIELSVVRLKLQRFLEKAILSILGVDKENEGQYLTKFL